MKTPAPLPLRRRDAAMLLAAVALAGCASRSAAPRRLYGLTGTPELPADQQPGADNRAWVLSPQIALPELLDRDEMLVAEGSAGLRPLPDSRWAEPLRDALPRLLVEDLWRLRQPYPVTLGKQHTPDGESLRLVVSVDEWLARADAAGFALRLRARWHWLPLQAPAGTALPPPGAAALSLPCSAQADALAAAYRRSVTLLAGRIVAGS